MNQAHLAAFFPTVLPFWQSLSAGERRSIVTSSLLQIYQPGSFLEHSMNEYSPGVQIIKRGKARVFIGSQHGKQLTLQQIPDKQNYAFGFSCVLPHVAFNINLETETRCEIVLIPRVVCMKLFNSNLAVKDTVLRILANRLSKTMRILENVAFQGARSRLASALVARSESAESLVIQVTHARLAADTGTLREAVTRQLEKLQLAGAVTLRRGKIEIHDIQVLRNMCFDISDEAKVAAHA